MSDKTLCINCGKLVLGPRVQNESTSAGRAKQHTFGCLTVVLFHPFSEVAIGLVSKWMQEGRLGGSKRLSLFFPESHMLFSTDSHL